MGIKFYCPNGHKMHVKGFLAGKKGLCPKCGVRVEIPTQSVASPPTQLDHPKSGRCGKRVITRRTATEGGVAAEPRAGFWLSRR